MNFVEGQLYFAIVQAKSFEVSDASALKDSSDKGVLVWINLKEPEITITVPQTDCIRWIVRDVGGT